MHGKTPPQGRLRRRDQDLNSFSGGKGLSYLIVNSRTGPLTTMTSTILLEPRVEASLGEAYVHHSLIHNKCVDTGFAGRSTVYSYQASHVQFPLSEQLKA